MSVDKDKMDVNLFGHSISACKFAYKVFESQESTHACSTSSIFIGHACAANCSVNIGL